MTIKQIRDFSEKTANTEFEKTGFGAFSDMREAIDDMNKLSSDFSNNAIGLLSSLEETVVDALIAARFSSVNLINKIYLDINEDGGGDGIYVGNGSIGTPYNDPLSALNALVDGANNEIHCRTGVYEVGEFYTNTTYLNFYNSNTSIHIVETDGAGTVEWKAHGYKYSNGLVYSGISLRFFNDFSFSSDAKITAVEPDAQGITGVGSTALFIFPDRQGISVKLSFSDDITLNDNISLISPNGNPSVLTLNFNNVNLSGGGKLIKDSIPTGGVNICNAYNLTSDGATKIYNNLLNGKENLLTNIPTSSILV